MDPKHYQKIKEILATALELPKGKVKSYLDAQCENNPELRQQVELLLNQDMEHDFLEKNSVEVSSTENEQPLLNGQIGRISLNHLIASGGMGEVYAGTDQILKRQVAVKVIKSGLNLSSKGRADFLHEAQVLSSLHHPNICQVFDFFEEDGQDILVLELVEGKTLRQYLKHKQQIKPLEIAKQIVDALVVAHERGIIHRDLKPDNIMITNQGVVKILDFGLARLDSIKGTPPLFEASNNQTTNQTQISGTPGYMSPEQAQGQRSNTSTDLWSFGIILCELICGQQPHPKNSSANELIERTKQAQYELPKNIASKPKNLIKKLLAPLAKDRPTARETLNEIIKIKNLPKKRLRWFLSSCLVAIGLFSIWKYTTDLKEQKNKANLARIEAEKLASFMLHDLHPQLRALGKLGLLEAAATETLSYYDHLDSEQRTKTLDKQALALIKIASVFDDQGHTEKALDTYKKSKLILIQLNQAQPENEEILLRLGEVRMNIGELLTIIGDFDASLIELKAAVEIGENLIKGFPPELETSIKPDTKARWWLHLRSIYMITDTHRRKGELDLAMKRLSEILPVAKKAATKSPSLMPNYADITYMYCTTLFQVKIDQEVLDACIETARLSELALANSPNEFRLNFNHSIDLGFLANLYRNLNQYEKAIQTIDKALAISYKLNLWDPENQSTENDLISNLNIKGQILFEQGNHKASHEIFEEAYQRILKLTITNEELHFVHNKLHAEIYLNKLNEAQATAKFLKSKGMKTRDLLELFKELDKRVKNTINPLQQ